jgi:hypothetical protein
MALTCGWQVSFAGDHEARVVLCVFSSHLRYIQSGGAASWFSVHVWVAYYMFRCEKHHPQGAHYLSILKVTIDKMS